MDQKSNIMYAISKGDMFLRPVDGPDGALTSTEIYRYDGDHFIIHDRAQRIIERSCRHYGESYSGRKAQAKRIANISNKTPILLTPIYQTYFFPTHSDRVPENSWLNMHYVVKLKPLKGARCKVTFANDLTVTLPISHHSVKHQFLNCVYFAYLVGRSNQVQTHNPEKPIDYDQQPFNIFEALSQYALLENAKRELEEKKKKTTYL
ncbi:competence protein ComK [Staphylococcus pseudintermedius]|uniref:Competence protein ComK n=2 Tax=Staphylococcus pseudintermedius TaxID=283734 RepID=A0A2P5PEC7_STAPS|nr:competence protein ComK [Staphylococcus pseudintermedius]AZB66483.1 competence transcription factor [Staphylococcus phage phiSP15-1]ADV05257.1 Competence transcription factor [Staphylococcus pseudintermedius HKU10-03]ANQ88727.1 competence protein ComK [Staphylococcus pseudintermedius]AYG57068.1 competence protein ComK [Staphylococcus pseudintermedius]EGQ0290378.1 competence protein ComK [Staphylococcus pseudintermedius]